MTIEEILANRSKPDANGCMNWLGCKGTRGYGWAKLDGEQATVHRIVWRHFHGEIPDGMFICHHCDNPSCANPEHLFLGTPYDNIKDMVEKGRQAKGEKIGLARLKRSDVISMRKAHRLGSTATSLARKYGVEVSTVHNALIGKTWKHIPGALREDEIHQDGLKGEGSGVNKLSVSNVIEIRKLYDGGEDTPALAKKFGVSVEQIRCVLTGHSWSHLPGAVKKLRHGRVGPAAAKTVAEMGAQGIQGRVIAEKLGMSEPVVYGILSGRSYSYITGINPKEHKDGRTKEERRKRRS